MSDALNLRKKRDDEPVNLPVVVEKQGGAIVKQGGAIVKQGTDIVRSGADSVERKRFHNVQVRLGKEGKISEEDLSTDDEAEQARDEVKARIRAALEEKGRQAARATKKGLQQAGSTLKDAGKNLDKKLEKAIIKPEETEDQVKARLKKLERQAEEKNLRYRLARDERRGRDERAKIKPSSGYSMGSAEEFYGLKSRSLPQALSGGIGGDMNMQMDPVAFMLGPPQRGPQEADRGHRPGIGGDMNMQMDPVAFMLGPPQSQPHGSNRKTAPIGGKPMDYFFGGVDGGMGDSGGTIPDAKKFKEFYFGG